MPLCEITHNNTGKPKIYLCVLDWEAVYVRTESYQLQEQKLSVWNYAPQNHLNTDAE